MIKLFGIGKLTSKLLFPLLMVLFSFLSLMSYKGLRNVYYINTSGAKTHFYQKPFLVAWVMSLSELCAVFFFAIQRNRSRRKKNIDKDNQMTQYNNNLIEKDTIGKNVLEIFPGKDKLSLFIKIIPICVLDCVSIIVLSILREGDNSFYELDYRGLLIIVTTCLSIKFLNYKYYWHHLLGIALIIIGIIIFTLCEAINSESGKGNNILLCSLLSILIQFCTGFQETTEKFLMDKNYVSPFIIVAIEGFFGNLFLSIAFIFLSKMKCGDETTKTYLHCNPYSNNSHVIEDILSSFQFVLRHKQFLWMLIALFVSFLMFNIFRVLTNSKCSPTHRGIADILGYFFFWMMRFIDFFEPTSMHSGTNLLFASISYLLMLIGVLIYLELIIVNVCGFEKDTDSGIINRASIENERMSLFEIIEEDKKKKIRNTIS